MGRNTEPEQARFEDPQSERHEYFTMIPNIIDDDSRLTLTAFRLLCHYRRVASQDRGSVWEGTPECARKLSMSRSTVIEGRRLLESLGYIQTERVLRDKDKKWVAGIIVKNVWTLNSQVFRARSPRDVKDLIITDDMKPFLEE